MKVFVFLLCVALVAVASGSPAVSGWLDKVNSIANDNIGKATNVASEKGKEGLAKVKELIAELQKQAEKTREDISSALTEAEKVAKQWALDRIDEQIERLKKVEEKLSGWMG